MRNRPGAWTLALLGACADRHVESTGQPCLDADDALVVVACIAADCGEKVESITCEAFFDGQTWQIDDSVETERPRLNPGETCSADCVYTAAACTIPLGIDPPVAGDAFLHASADVSPPGGTLAACGEIDARR